MTLSNNDRRLLSRVRKETGAQNESQLPPEDLERELERAKTHLNDELQQSLGTGSLNFYEGDSMEELLFSFLCLRVWSLTFERDNSNLRLPDTMAWIRRHDFSNPQANYWRDNAIRNLNRLIE